MMEFQQKMELERAKHELELAKHAHEKARDAASVDGTGGGELLKALHAHLTAPMVIDRDPLTGRAIGARRVISPT